MSIVFGWNHFRIKAYSPAELGIPTGKEQQLYQIELRQRYFHLFWIPFFSIGQKWVLRKGHQLYELPLELEMLVNTKDFRSKTPWYTFAGPIFSVLALMIWWISDTIQDANREKASRNYYNAQIKKREGQYLASATSDYYVLHPQKGADQIVLLQVAEVKPKEIVFRKLVTGLEGYKLTPRKIESFFLTVPHSETTTISKEKLSRAVNIPYESQYTGIDLFGEGSEYIVKDIFRMNGPLLQGLGYGSYGMGRLTLEFQNVGWPGSLVRIENKAGDIRWNNSLPQEVASATSDYDPDGRIVLSGENYKSNMPYEFEMVMIDSLSKEHRYNIKGKMMEKTNIAQLY